MNSETVGTKEVNVDEMEHFTGINPNEYDIDFNYPYCPPECQYCHGEKKPIEETLAEPFGSPVKLSREQAVKIARDSFGSNLNPSTFDEAAHRIAHEIAVLICRKQADYGHGNISAFGELGVKVRSSDKRARLRHLLDKMDELADSKPLNEPLEDSWLDMGGYAIIALMWERGWFMLELDNSYRKCPNCGSIWVCWNWCIGYTECFHECWDCENVHATKERVTDGISYEKLCKEWKEGK